MAAGKECGLDIRGSSGNDLGRDQNNSPSTQDELRVSAWAEVGNLWNCNLRRSVDVL